MRRSRLVEDLKELAWAVLLLDAIAFGCGALLAAYFGRRVALYVGGGFALLITATLGGIAAANLLVIAVLTLRTRRRRAEGLSSRTST